MALLRAFDLDSLAGVGQGLKEYLLRKNFSSQPPRESGVAVLAVALASSMARFICVTPQRQTRWRP